jgi:hypothetical protein
MLFGVTLAAAALTRGQALVLLPIAIGAWAITGYRGRDLVSAGLLATVSLALCLAPWAARNARVLDSPVVISTNIGANLWIGNHEGASGRMAIDAPEPPQPEPPPYCAGLQGFSWQICRRGDRTQGEYEAAADRLALREGLEYMVTHPMRELELAVTKVRALYESDATALDWNKRFRSDEFVISQNSEDALRVLANGFWFAMLIASGVALLAARTMRTGSAGTLVLLVLAWTATHVLFFGDPRFHYPVVFVFAILGARGLIFMYDALRRPEAELDSRYAAA